MTHKEHLKALEKILKESKQFVDVMDYFFTHLGEDPTFIKASEYVSEHPILQSLASQYKQQETDSQEPAQLFLHKAKEVDFFHGTFDAGLRLCTIIYFDKSEVGLLTSTPMSLHGPTNFYRFWATKIEIPK